MSSPTPEPDPPADPDDIVVPPPCNRYPTCEGYADDPTFPYPGDCTWPSCSEPLPE